MSTLQDTVKDYLRPVDKAGGPTPKNVSETERLVSAAAGALLVKVGLHRGLLSLTGLGLTGLGASLIKRGYTGQCSLYQKMGVDSHKPASPEQYFHHGIHVKSAITIDRPAAELYEFWRNFSNLPSFMGHLKSVTPLDGNRSCWVAKGPMGTDVKWDAEVINDVPGETIAWRSLAGAQVDNAGSVRFIEAPGGRGTEVRVNLDYIPPGRTVGKWVAKLFGEEPSQQIRQDLRKFKQVMETGVLSTTEGQPRGTKQE